MRLGSSAASFLLLALPLLTNAAVASKGAFNEFDNSALNKDVENTRYEQEKTAPVPPPQPVEKSDASLQEPLGPKSSLITRTGAGTKDAPVDGKDGKPHHGPWVDAVAHKEDDVASGKTDDAPVPKPLTGTKKRPHEVEEVKGVMNDPNRESPKQGTTGTEGGVTEKTREQKEQELSGEKVEKTPEQPKKAPSLPHSEEVKLKDAESGKPPGSGQGSAEKPGSKGESSTVPSSHELKDDASPLVPIGEEVGLIQPLHSWVLSFTMILFSEIGDKTFLIAALMAMKHDRLVVFSAAFSALIAMTVLSAVLGHAVPTLISKRLTNFAAAILFLVFGARLLREGLAMSPTLGVSEEMKEVEMELEESAVANGKRRRSSVSPYVLESGRRARSNSHLPRRPSTPSSTSSSPSRAPARSALAGIQAGFVNLLSLLLSPAWVQTFIMTFLGEWGDRSQIATIAMAAGQDYWWVTAGAVSGHGVCTGVAVIGGRAIAGKVSLRIVTLGGAIAFLAFGFIYLIEAFYV